jgi:hypothetical protein
MVGYAWIPRRAFHLRGYLLLYRSDTGIYQHYRRVVLVSWLLSTVFASSMLWSDALIEYTSTGGDIIHDIPGWRFHFSPTLLR